jgi:hypothetical protein
MQVGLEALNRADFEAGYAFYDTQVELISDPRFVELGFDRVYRGRAERIRFQQRWTAEWGDSLPVLDESAVGLFDLFGELAFVALLALAGLGAGALAAARRIAGHQFEPAQLAAGERWPFEGVVLAAAEQLPEQHAELAGGCH